MYAAYEGFNTMVAAGAGAIILSYLAVSFLELLARLFWSALVRRLRRRAR